MTLARARSEADTVRRLRPARFSSFFELRRARNRRESVCRPYPVLVDSPNQSAMLTSDARAARTHFCEKRPERFDGLGAGPILIQSENEFKVFCLPN